MFHPAQRFSWCTLHISKISRVTIYSLDILLSQFGISLLSMSSSNCCFLTWIQISQEAGQVVWYSHPLKNFPQFVMIHTVKGFSVVNEAEVDVFLELSCFSYDTTDVGNLISGSSAFSKSSFNIWTFLVHVLMKPSLEVLEYLTNLGEFVLPFVNYLLCDLFSFGIGNCYLLWAFAPFYFLK